MRDDDAATRPVDEVGKLAKLFTFMRQPKLAAELYEQLVSHGSGDADWWNNLAWQLVSDPDPALHDPPRAVQLANKASELAPNSGAIWKTLAVAHYRTGDWQASVDAVERALALESRQLLDCLTLAMALHKLGDANAARLWFDRAERAFVSLSPPSDEVQRFRAEALDVLGIATADGSAPPPESNADAAEKWLQAARGLVAAGELRKAIARFDAAAGLTPDNDAVRLERARAAESLKLWPRVVEDYSSVLTRRPEDTTIRHQRAAVYRTLNAWNEAVADYTRILERNPDDWQARLARWELYNQLGQANLAQADADVLINVPADDAKLHELRARLLTARARARVKANELDKALADFDESVKLQPDDASLRIERGNVARTRRQWDKAVLDYSRAIELRPGNSTYHATRGRLYFEQGDIDKALADANQAVELDANSHFARSERGRINFLIGQYDAAAPDLAFAVQSQQLHPEYSLLHGILLLNSGKSEAYRQNCAEVLRQFGNTPDGWIAYFAARACVLAPKAITEPQRAVDLAERAVKFNPKLPAFLNTLALAHHRAGQHDAAITRAQESITRDSQWVPPMNWLALTLAHHAKGQSTEARESFNKADAWLTQEQTRLATAPKPPPHPSHWLEIQILHREAKSLLEVKP